MTSSKIDYQTKAGATLRFATQEQVELYKMIEEGYVPSKDINFATSISTHRNPSSSQLYWVKKLADEAKDRMVLGQKPGVGNSIPQPKVFTQFNFSKIYDMFLNARQHLKRPKIVLLLDANNVDGLKVRFGATEDGKMWISSGPMGSPVYGKADLTTNMLALRQFGEKHKEQLFKLLEEFCADPETVAIVHGKLMGHCCFCSLPLTDPRSLNHGYGETCAKHWHLPWGQTAPLRPVTDWITGGQK